MYLAYMKNQSTAAIYSKGLKVLLPKGFDWKDAGVDVGKKDDIQDLAKQMLSWKAFSSDSSSL